MRIWHILVLCLSSFITRLSYAYPEFVRHGYVNCMTCHVSPTGGTLMTDYGRSMSKELLSRWGFEGEEKLLYSIEQPEWLKVGGNFRALQTYVNNPSQTVARFFSMQTEVQAAARANNIWFMGSVGAQGGPRAIKDEGRAYSREHYVMYQPTDEIYLRAGKYVPEFGIRSPNHTLVTRRDISLDQGMEPYNMDVGYMGEKYNVVVTGIFGRPDITTVADETGVALSVSRNLESSKIGVSLLRGYKDTSQRWLAGAYGMLGFSKQLYALSEVDFQWLDNIGAASTAKSQGLVSSQILAYEWMRGFQVYGIHQLSYLDYGDPLTRTDAFGSGLKMYPRPHFEIQLEFKKERRQSRFSGHYDTAWLLLHYYL